MRTGSFPKENDFRCMGNGRTGSLPEDPMRADIESFRLKHAELRKKGRKMSIRNFGDITARIRRQSSAVKIFGTTNTDCDRKKSSPEPILPSREMPVGISYEEELPSIHVDDAHQTSSGDSPDRVDNTSDFVFTVTEAPGNDASVPATPERRRGRRKTSAASKQSNVVLVTSQSSVEEEESRRQLLESNIHRLDTPVEEPRKRAKSPSLGRRLRRLTISGNQNAASALKAAVADQDYETLQKLLNQGSTDNSTQPYDINHMYSPGVSLLHQACILGDFQTVKLLVEKGADVTMVTWSNLSPLLLATTCGHFDVAQLLLLAGANVEDVKNGHQELGVHHNYNHNLKTGINNVA